MSKISNVDMPRTRKESALFVIDSIKALGIEPNPTSRIMKMWKLLTQSKGDMIKSNHPEFETALESIRDIQQFEFIFNQVDVHSVDDIFRKKVKMSLKDSELPQDDREQSSGRDIQFELFAWAVCQSASLTPVKFEEPDVSCVVDGVQFGIAAKRVKNVTRFEERIRGAAKQIMRSNLPGIIALETSVAFNRENDRIVDRISDEEFSSLYQSALTSFLDEFHDRFQQWVRGKGVRGIVLHDSQVRQDPDGDWPLQGMTLFVCTSRENQRRNREYSLFCENYEKGFPNLEKL